jgi:hypothetical protein
LVDLHRDSFLEASGKFMTPGDPLIEWIATLRAPCPAFSISERVSLASFSVWASWSLAGSAACAVISTNVSKIGTKNLATDVTQAAFIGVFSIGFLFGNFPTLAGPHPVVTDPARVLNSRADALGP